MSDTDTAPTLEASYVLDGKVCRYEVPAASITEMREAAHRFHTPERNAATFEEFERLTAEAMAFTHFVVERTMLDEHPGWCDPRADLRRLFGEFLAQQQS